jgi:homoserine O-acetyltransferase
MAQAHKYDPPDSAASVGWTESKRLELVAPGDAPLQLEAGGRLANVVVEYETYGTLNAARDNVVLITHALSGDAHVAGWDRLAGPDHRPWRTRAPGWWDAVVGPGKAIDTNHFFVVCANVPGSCYGTTGPASVNPQTGQAYGLDFPLVTVGDWVTVQARLLDALGVGRLHAVVGGSLGGQQALEWSLRYPDRVARAIVLAAAPRLSAQGLAYNAVARASIMGDPNFRDGNYYGQSRPDAGLAVARMLAHVTYLSDRGMHEKFGRRLRNKLKPDFSFGVEFEVESYLQYQAKTFIERFDANSYLYVTRAMDYYDAAEQWGGGDLTEACRRIRGRVMVVSFSTDTLYPPEHCREFAEGLCRAGKTVTYVDVPSPFGHDAFLVETATVGRLLKGFLRETELEYAEHI